MKRTYQSPEVTAHDADISQELLASSYVSVGGTGTFDVKAEDEWPEVWTEDDLQEE